MHYSVTGYLPLRCNNHRAIYVLGSTVTDHLHAMNYGLRPPVQPQQVL